MSDTITTLADFQTLLEREYYPLAFGRWSFRGHSASHYTIIPSAGRVVHTSRSRAKFEQSIFDIFKRGSIGHRLPFVPRNDWEWLALAQHHKLPTRLLDWTFNPFVGLYFAVESHPNQDGVLYALRAEQKLSATRQKKSPFVIDRPRKYIPSMVTDRIKAQDGLFVAFSDPEQPLDLCCPSDWELRSFVVPAAAKEALAYGLFRQGIHRASLFPDLDGLAVHLRWRHTTSGPTSRGPVARPAT